METFARNELYWGKENQLKLKNSDIAVFGLGGVGSFAVEALARSGIENFTIVDFDKVSKSNINRQLIALQTTVGQTKAEVTKQRILQINNNAKVNEINDFYTSDMHEVFKEKFDFVVDAIDSYNFKIDLLEFCYQNNIPIITSMGAASRIDPEKLYIKDISEVDKVNCPFATRIIKRLKQDGITKNLPLVLSSEKPKAAEKILNTEIVETKSGQHIEFNKITPATTPFVAPAAGILMASYVVRKLIN
ncbi:MAG: tRNA threonylcarbamoyladenosine dehydratase [Candidatus Gastranaerophilales bacterium]|nr:tRNA threonylcarbamoyladenosine dehydratase [Candidatus Gastranaerophilales bacterium]